MRRFLAALARRRCCSSWATPRSTSSTSCPGSSPGTSRDAAPRATATPTGDRGARPPCRSRPSTPAPQPLAAGVAPARRSRTRRPWPRRSRPWSPTRRCGPGPGVVVRDAFTGQTLLHQGRRHGPGCPPRRPSCSPRSRSAPRSTRWRPCRRRWSRAPRPDELVLVAGGDTMLAKGKGTPTAVEGRAGLGDLAGQVAAALQAAGTTNGHPAARHHLRARGRAGRRAGARPTSTPATPVGCRCWGWPASAPMPFKPAPRDPEAATGAAFVAALRPRSAITATLAPRVHLVHARRRPVPPSSGGCESAPIGDILALALDDSDNALTEGLARQAAVQGRGRGHASPAAVAFVPQGRRRPRGSTSPA